MLIVLCSVLGPINDDAVLHILRLRDKLSWQTLLPPCEFVKSKDVTKFRKIPLLVFSFIVQVNLFNLFKIQSLICIVCIFV